MGVLIFDRGYFIKVLIIIDKATNASEQPGIQIEAWPRPAKKEAGPAIYHGNQLNLIAGPASVTGDQLPVHLFISQ